MTDAKLNRETLKRLKKGDMVAFDAIYKRYCPGLHKFVLQLIKDEAETQGIVQEVFIKIWEKRDNINTSSSFDSFIFTIAYNITISLLRKKINEKKYLSHLELIQKVNSQPDVIDELHFTEIKNKVQKLIEQLPQRQKDVFLLSREKGLTYDEIAKSLNISINTVRNHIAKANSFIKKNIDKSLLFNTLFISLFLL